MKKTENKRKRGRGWPIFFKKKKCGRLTSCGPGFEYQAQHLFQFIIQMWRGKDENKQKEAGIGQYLKKVVERDCERLESELIEGKWVKVGV